MFTRQQFEHANSLALAAALAPRQRVYGFENIRRHLQQKKRDHARGAETSIATGNRHGGPHLHQREIARRRRQAAARAAR